MNTKSVKRGFMDAERMEKVNLTIDQLKLQYQPKISQNAEVLEEQKK